MTQLLCSAYGLTPNDAQTVINAFVEEVKESVSTRGVYIIEGVGNITTIRTVFCGWNPKHPSNRRLNHRGLRPQSPSQSNRQLHPKRQRSLGHRPVTPSASPADSRPVSQTVPPVHLTSQSLRHLLLPHRTQPPRHGRLRLRRRRRKTVYSQQPTFQQKNSGAPAATTQKPRSTYDTGPGQWTANHQTANHKSTPSGFEPSVRRTDITSSSPAAACTSSVWPYTARTAPSGQKEQGRSVYYHRHSCCRHCAGRHDFRISGRTVRTRHRFADSACRTGRHTAADSTIMPAE